jgi:phage terminase large subunit-like protein
MSGLGFTPFEPHPVLQMPTPEEALAMGAEKWIEAMRRREKAIRDEQAQPLWKAWEPPIWKVCDALWGAPWLDGDEAEAIRRNLGFRKPVNILLLLGGWGSSKTEYAAMRISRLMQLIPKQIFWFMHETRPSQQDQQDPIIYKYLPPNLKTDKAIMEKVTYVAYKEKTGFSEGSFVLPNHSRGRFWTYEGGVDKLQGPTVKGAWGDELMPPEFVTAVGSRVGRGNGVFFITFAPIHGHTATVQEQCDGAEIVREITAFLDPEDGGPRDVARYLGLTEAEYAKLRDFNERKEKPPFPNVPWSRPEDCSKWLTGEPSQPEAPEGRRFRKIPRVLKPEDPEESRAVVLFNGSDNPFGRPLSVYTVNGSASQELANRYFYGYTKAARANMFPKFDEKVHTIADGAIPLEGTNYLFVDPAQRNFFMTWIRFVPGAAYIYREWPGNYEIPGVGVPGPWALPDAKLGDGRKGPAQDSFGFGLADYKYELARLEGWNDLRNPRPAGMSKTEWVKGMFAANGAREHVLRRFIDSRYASTPHIENDRPVTMLENFATIGLHFEPTPGDEIDEGVKFLNDWLGYDTTLPIDALNKPYLYVAKSCRNTIFAFKTWKNQERGKGATKDPIDNPRYATLQGVGYVPADAYVTEGGGSY